MFYSGCSIIYYPERIQSGRLVLYLVVFLLGACSADNTRPERPVPVEDRSVVRSGDVVGDTQKQYSDAEIITPSGDSSADSDGFQNSPMVIAQLQQVDEFESTEKLEQAAAVVERLLRIEPANAYLWYRLAGLRYRQKNWQQTIHLARKSNNLASLDSNLKHQNYKLIAAAYGKAGDFEAAAAAEQKARSYASEHKR